MNKKFIAWKFLILFFAFPKAHAACPEISKSLEEKAIAFAVKLKLIDRGNEYSMKMAQVEAKYRIQKVVAVGDHCILNIRLQVKSGEDSEWGREFETAVIDSRTLKFSLFEAAFPPTKRLYLGIGSTSIGTLNGVKQTHLNPILYYVELTDQASIIAAMKAVLMGETYGGFSGEAIPGAKATFDPTPGREWKIVRPRFSISRGNSGETLDIQAAQLDADFSGYFKGALKGKIKVKGEVVPTLLVTPWGDSTIRRYLSADSQWVPLLEEGGEHAGKPLPLGNVPEFILSRCERAVLPSAGLDGLGKLIP